MSKKPSDEQLMDTLKELQITLDDPDIPEVMKADIPIRMKLILEELRKRFEKNFW